MVIELHISGVIEMDIMNFFDMCRVAYNPFEVKNNEWFMEGLECWCREVAI